MYWKISITIFLFLSSVWFISGLYNSILDQAADLKNINENSYFFRETSNSYNQEQYENALQITETFKKMKEVTLKYDKFPEPEKKSKSLYDFEITGQTFSQSFYNLCFLSAYFNELNAVNRSKIIIKKLKELVEDYPVLFKGWKGPHGNTISCSLNEVCGRNVVTQLEVSWCLKIIFCICLTEEKKSPLEAIENFSAMVRSVKTNDFTKAKIFAEKLNLGVFDRDVLEFIADSFGILCKIIETNFANGFLKKDSLK